MCEFVSNVEPEWSAAVGHVGAAGVCVTALRRVVHPPRLLEHEVAESANLKEVACQDYFHCCMCFVCR